VTTAADIRALPSGEFAQLVDGSIQPFIDEAAREVSADVFGTIYEDAVKYLAAHLLAGIMSGSKGAAGPVISETAGPLSRSFSAPVVSATDSLQSTAYGRRYLDLRRQVAGGPQVL